MIGYDQIAAICRYLDTQAEMTSSARNDLWEERYEVDLPDLVAVAMQRALRWFMDEKGLDRETQEQIEVPMNSEERAQQVKMGATWVDGFAAGIELTRRRHGITILDGSRRP